MGYKVNPPSTDELRQMAVQRLGASVAQSGTPLTADQAKKLLEELAISKVEVEIQNVYLQDTCARLDVALNEITDLYDFAPVGFVSTDASGKINKLNLAGASLLGADRNTLMGRKLADLLLPQQRDCVQALMRRAAASSEDQCGEVMIGQSDGVDQHVLLSLAPLSTGQGFHMVLTNISERKAQEVALLATGTRWKLLLEANGDGVWDWDVQADVLHYSNSLAQRYGVPTEPLGGTMEGWRAHVHPDDWPTLLKQIQSCLGGQQVHFSTDHRTRAADGRWDWVRCQGVVCGHDEAGKVTHMVGVLTDIAEQRQMEEDLREVRGIQQALFELLPQYLAVLDGKGRVLQTNAMWNAYGLASGHTYRNGFFQSPYAELLDAVTGSDGDSKASALCGIADVLAGKVPSFQLEYSYVSDAGRRWFIMLVMAVQGERARAVVSHQDVSRIKNPSALLSTL
ncbi:hypothetical protein DIC66_01250 [Rhodoferax lacus]|uniref:histidine kinase n=1 Tax=Rhodoferax lacus TaxID=2184758 RepID=A0A3E1RGQ8_9BURK|nr:PAS domain-containing protein [Rhodoferax lacus]RFO98544.1 hypothetical protein DIC66_01250 [Rhodoferax lacus]